MSKSKRWGLSVTVGDCAETIPPPATALAARPGGTRLAVGATLLEVTQIGKECHSRCAIYRQAGDCVMPKEGIFARVLRGGTVRPEDSVVIE